MTTIKQILVPLDFSELSIQALNVASKVAELFQARVKPVHVHIPISEMDEPYALGMSSSVYQDLDLIEDNLQKKLAEVTSEVVPDEYLSRPAILFGNPAQSIIDLAAAHDIIIMSSHGRTGFSRFLLGSVAEKIIRLAPVPVIVTDSDSDIGNFEKILVTTDFSENAEAVFPLARAFARKAGSKIHLLNILSFDQVEKENSDMSLESIRHERFKIIAEEHFSEFKSSLTYNVEIAFTSPHEAILRHIRDYSYNLVLMSTVGRTGINYMMMGSTTTNVVRHVNTAVLSVNPRTQNKEPS